jgi:PKD repeat protein
MARTASGAIWTWGDNQYGQLGDGTTTRRTSPVRVLASGAAALDAGAHHSVTVRSDGTVLTWGRGYRGQLGLGSLANRPTPTVVPGLPPAVEVGDGRDQTFAVTADGRVWAWGDNSAGQLGDGTTTTRPAPVQLGVTGVAAVQSGATHTVFLPVDAAPPANQAPTAAFSVSCTALDCTVDGTGSTDLDGAVTGHDWSFGDGATASGALVTHTFAAAGTYRVSLTVTDDDGVTGTRQSDVTVAAAPGATVEFVAAAAANTNATTHRVVLPASVAAGDGLVLVLTVNTAGTVPEPVGGPAWAGVENLAGADHRTRVWDRVAVTGDAGRVVTVTLPATAKASLAALVYRGSGPQVVTASSAVLETVSRVQHTTPPVAVTEPGSVLLSVWADKSSSTTTMTPPSGTAQRVLSVGSSGGRITALVADSTPPAGTAAGLTATASAASAKATMVSLVLAPAP